MKNQLIFFSNALKTGYFNKVGAGADQDKNAIHTHIDDKNPEYIIGRIILTLVEKK